MRTHPTIVSRLRTQQTRTDLRHLTGNHRPSPSQGGMSRGPDVYPLHDRAPYSIING